MSEDKDVEMEEEEEGIIVLLLFEGATLPGPTPRRAMDEIRSLAATGPDGTSTDCASISTPSSTSPSLWRSSTREETDDVP